MRKLKKFDLLDNVVLRDLLEQWFDLNDRNDFIDGGGGAVSGGARGCETTGSLGKFALPDFEWIGRAVFSHLPFPR